MIIKNTKLCSYLCSTNNRLNAAYSSYFCICYKVDLPLIKESRNSTKKIKNKILAIPAAPAAMPPNPNIAAIIAITRNVIVQPNIIVIFKG